MYIDICISVVENSWQIYVILITPLSLVYDCLSGGYVSYLRFTWIESRVCTFIPVLILYWYCALKVMVLSSASLEGRYSAKKKNQTGCCERRQDGAGRNFECLLSHLKQNDCIASVGNSHVWVLKMLTTYAQGNVGEILHHEIACQWCNLSQISSKWFFFFERERPSHRVYQICII